MDEQEYNQTVERLNEVNKVIEGLDASIRADAFKLLKPYVAAGAVTDDEDDTEEEGETPKKQTAKRSAGGSVDFDELIETHESDTDYENALLALAIVYARHGKGPYALSLIKGAADEFNLTIPARLDMTFKTLKRDEKEVLRKQADGWKVTPSGETWLKATYGVTRGKQPVSAASGS